MKKIIKCTIALLIIYFIGCLINNSNIYAIKITEEPTDIYVTRKITNVSGKVENTFTYSITPVSGNPSEVDGMPEEFSIVFDDEYENDVANATKTLNVSEVNFSDLGLYKFKIKEISSSNPDIYPVDKTNSYEIYVVVSNESGVNKATLIGPAEHYVSDVDKNEKTAIEFCSEKVKEESDKDKEKQEEPKEESKNPIKNIIETISPKTGDNIIWYCVIFSIAIFVIIVIMVIINKQKDKTETNKEENKKDNNE